MDTKSKQALLARVSDIGERTRTAVFIELTHDLQCQIMVDGQLADIAFCSTNLDHYVKEILSGRQKLGPSKLD